MNKSTNLFLLACTLLLVACAEQQTELIKTEAIEAQGAFLFEGPNTLTGELSVSLDDTAKALEVSKESIDQVKVSNLELTFETDSLSQYVESVLVQVVSDNNSLVTIGTKSPWNVESGEFNLNGEFDLLPYLQDSGSQLVVDVNLKQDLDDLKVYTFFEIEIKYTK